MEKFIISFFTYCAYMVGLATIMLGVATIFIPVYEGTYNTTIMGSVLILLGGQVFLVTRKILDN